MLDLLLLCLFSVPYIVISEVSVLTVTVKLCHGYMAMYPASGEDRHIGQGVNCDVYMAPVFSRPNHVYEFQFRSEEPCALPQSLNEVCCIVPYLSYGFRFCLIGEGHAPIFTIIEVGIH